MALDISRFVGRFVEEARDHVSRLEEGLTALTQEPDDGERLNAIFRSAHTIKGSSRMLKLTGITDTAHQLEEVLGGLREGRFPFTPDLGRLLQRAVDAIAGQVETLAETHAAPAADPELCAVLARAAAGGTTPTPGAGDPPPPPPSPTPEPDSPGTAAPPPPPPAAEGDGRFKTPDTVRIRLAKLDEMIKLMGEVVSSHARLRQRLVEARQLERLLLNEGSPLTGTLPPPVREQLRRFVATLQDDVTGQELLMGALNDRALVMRMLPLATVFDPSARLVRNLARSLGREVECRVSGGEIELDRQMIDKLSDPLVHLLRNAVDHGIETAAERNAAGKPPHGRIHLHARQDGAGVVIEVGDDGAGLHLEQIRAKAVQKGLVPAERAAALEEEQVLDLIFMPGFSTSPIITDVSGRGVGMDVVKRTIVDDLRGAVEVTSTPGHGTRFALRLPLSLAVMRLLLCRSGQLTFGFTAQFVVELIRVAPGELMEVAGQRAMVLRNEFIPLMELESLLQLPPSAAARPGAGDSPTLLVVVVQARHEKLGVVVEELVDERDMVIKSLPPHMRHLPLVSGMVVTGNNELVSVLHVPQLLDQARAARGARVSRQQAGETPPQESRILVVDDSLNTREIEKEVLEAHGYRVTLAEDGVDGLNKARSGTFAAILTDVEMPGMDGFTLTATLRREERYQATPIIIITSREKEEDKRRGIEAGADAYIVKGDFSQNNLVETLRNLLG